MRDRVPSLREMSIEALMGIYYSCFEREDKEAAVKEFFATMKERMDPKSISDFLNEANYWGLIYCELENGRLDIFKAFIELGKESDIANIAVEAGRGTRMKILFAAMLVENVDAVRCLLEAGADVNIDLNGITPLHAAVMYDYFEMASLLLEKGASANVATTNPIFRDSLGVG